MDNLLSKENILIVDSVQDWRDAIRLACEPMINSGSIEPRYVEAIFESTEKNGPYYVLAPDIAMPHAGSNDGVIKSQLGLMVLRKPVKFSEDGFDVRLIFTLAAKDTSSHLETLSALSDVFSNNELVNKLIEARNPNEIIEILSQ